ncbi:MaoC family dehydratase [Paenibacillus pini]|uniref:MaoC-like domain-containing protein n=1 Tax=Paenibacillus pini JCM 16418 TaxID=1236976 RepID=W7YLC5_9BACL|nr:MaoC family dehydratase [Paenibacillus pini]GAF09357.1 hypothetical protein JCM16418_3496 [Paenibacillus pini JCM 16418]
MSQRILVTTEAIHQYADASKDMAPIHLIEDAAIKAGYKRPVAHGMYIMGLAQSLYLQEHPSHWISTFQMKFHKPLFVDTVAIFNFEYSYGSIQVTVTEDCGEVVASGTFDVIEVTL